jgi:hypothetical protein
MLTAAMVAILASAGGMIDPSHLAGRWAMGGKPDVYVCEGAKVFLAMKQAGPETYEGEYSGEDVKEPLKDTFTLMPEQSEVNAARTTQGKILRFRTPRRTAALRWFVTAEDGAGRPTQMEWQRRNRAGQPFIPVFWMKRCD